MKTLVCISPGHFEYIHKEIPVPAKGHVLIKISRVGICGTDLHAFKGTQPYFSYPRILGHELAGEIEEIDDAAEFKKGDIVAIMPYFFCGNCFPCRHGKINCCMQIKVAGVHTDGGFAEYFTAPVNCLLQSQGLTIDEIALTEPLAIGAHGINRAQIKKDDFVLIIGAGPIGLALMEFAKLAGGKVLVMDVNEMRLEFCSNHLGVQIIRSSDELADITNGDLAPVVIDATGNLSAINNGFRYMSHGGRYVLVGLQKENIVFSHPDFHKKEGTLMSSRNALKQDFENVIHAIKNKKIDPMKYITHRVHFDEVKDQFPGWLNRESNVIKAMVSL
ncbi:MAG TPA: zinc-binding alcohol dehydrogenase family protein [Flavitalea sp.]|nr:zinc-binding alcohol dehydrogenase family protein [Flavitalea sp.]